MFNKINNNKSITLICTHRDFLIMKGDMRLRKAPFEKVPVHSCPEIEVWQERGQLKRYYLYPEKETIIEDEIDITKIPF